jgi:RNA polymerase sigma-70 factor (ECF subfamily)
MRVRGVEQASVEFAGFYESARDECLRVVLLNVGDRFLAEELVAEGFARAWVAWRKVRDLQVPQAWVVRVALNVNVSRWRRRKPGSRRSCPRSPHCRAAGQWRTR